MGIRDNLITFGLGKNHTNAGIINRNDYSDYFQGRSKIDIDTRIDKGVYLGKNTREAIVVDFDESVSLRTLFNVAYSRANRLKKGGVYEHLFSVYETTCDAFPFGGEKSTDEFIKRGGFGNNSKVHLDVFIRNGIGVCRHMALTAGVLLEKFIDKGFIDGKVSVDRSETFLERHAWARYTGKNGDVTIIDPALQYFGNIYNLSHNARWDYRRSEDRK